MGYITQDMIVGLRGKEFFGDGRWTARYYIDVGQRALVFALEHFCFLRSYFTTHPHKTPDIAR